MPINLYHADYEYCNYLYSIDRKVPIIKGIKENRPFVGMILCVNEKNFFAPLTSPKTKHLYMKETQDFIKIDNGKFGGINLNNMIPIPKRYLHLLNIDEIQDKKYAKLLKIQIEWLNKYKYKIEDKAEKLYYSVISNNAQINLIQRCCNFKLLEEKCYEYMKDNMIREDEIIYIY